MNTMTNLSEYGDVLVPEDIQEILHIGRNSVYRFLADGTIKSIRIGTKYRIPKKYLIDFMYPETRDAKGDVS